MGDQEDCRLDTYSQAHTPSTHSHARAHTHTHTHTHTKALLYLKCLKCYSRTVQTSISLLSLSTCHAIKLNVDLILLSFSLSPTLSFSPSPNLIHLPSIHPSIRQANPSGRHSVSAFWPTTVTSSGDTVASSAQAPSPPSRPSPRARPTLPEGEMGHFPI